MWQVWVETSDMDFAAVIFEGTRDQCEAMAQEAVGLPVYGGGTVTRAWASNGEQAVAPHGFE